MITRTLQNIESLDQLVADAQAFGEPIVVLDGEDECLVAMCPVVFERVLSDINALNRTRRSSLHL